MKYIKNIVSLALVIVAMASCELKDEVSGTSSSTSTGKLDLAVAVKGATTTRATTVSQDTIDTFEVVVTDSDGNSAYESTVANLPSSITFAVGDYTIVAHTSGEIQKQMTYAYYYGSSDLTIKKDVTTEATVTCSMKNSRIELIYSEEFLAAFASWTITVDDGSDKVLSYTEDNTDPDAVYWYFDDESVESITVNITAKTTSGNTISESRIFTKSNAESEVDSESDYFTGGDALEITMGATESGEKGTVSGITITTNITFDGTTEKVEIPTSSDSDDDSDDDSSSDSEASAITISDDGTGYLTKGVDYSKSEDGTNYPENVTVVMAITNGIANLYVEVDTDSSLFESAAGLLGLTDEGGVDLTSDDEDVEVLASLFDLPNVGDTSYTFSLNDTLWELLALYDGTHSFILTVVDQDGNSESATLTIRVNE